jgi:hypothetical protein
MTPTAIGTVEGAEFARIYFDHKLQTKAPLMMMAKALLMLLLAIINSSQSGWPILAAYIVLFKTNQMADLQP